MSISSHRSLITETGWTALEPPDIVRSKHAIFFKSDRQPNQVKSALSALSSSRREVHQAAASATQLVTLCLTLTISVGLDSAYSACFGIGE